MTRLFEGSDLVLATHNKGKVAEIAEMLKDYIAKVDSAGDLGLPEPEETGKTFIDNAILKARAASEASGRVALADDSGLEVTVLGGEPGIYSARWAGPERDFMHAMKRVHAAMGDAEDRSARFVCALALAWPDGHVETVEGEVQGTLVWPPRGPAGFGYDPMFVPQGDDRTFGEMTPEEKRAISHRHQAFKKIVMKCFR